MKDFLSPKGPFWFSGFFVIQGSPLGFGRFLSQRVSPFWFRSFLSPKGPPLGSWNLLSKDLLLYHVWHLVFLLWLLRLWLTIHCCFNYSNHRVNKKVHNTVFVVVWSSSWYKMEPFASGLNYLSWQQGHSIPGGLHVIF